MLARVKWFNNYKGYGFLLDNDGNDIFIHYTQILSKEYKTLSDNEIVKIGTVIKTNKGLQAQAVEKLMIQ